MFETQDIDDINYCGNYNNYFVRINSPKFLPTLSNGLGDNTFKIPNTYHLTRWIVKVIYCLQIYLFKRFSI